MRTASSADKPAIRAELLRELTALRRGYGVQSTNLRNRVGPHLGRLAEIPGNAGDREIRERVVRCLRGFAWALPERDRKVIDIAMGADRDARFPSLTERIRAMATLLSVSDRTARRLVGRAFELLADEILAAQDTVAAKPDNPDQGWQVVSFDALLRLDTPTPELIERRTITALRDGLSRITARLSLPRRTDSDPIESNLLAEVQQGARITERTREGEAHFRYLLDLPSTLNRGDQHRYTMTFRIPEGQPMRTHYAFVPLVACDWFRVRVRFDPDRLPKALWKLDRLPPRVMNDRLRPERSLELDRVAEAELEFTDMEVGYGYGLAWLPHDG